MKTLIIEIRTQRPPVVRMSVVIITTALVVPCMYYSDSSSDHISEIACLTYKDYGRHVRSVVWVQAYEKEIIFFFTKGGRIDFVP